MSTPRPRGIFVALSLTLAPLVAAGADAEGDFAIRGAGSQSCAALLQAWEEGASDLALYAGWIDGYLTGLNQHVEDTFEIAPWQTAPTLLSLIRSACAQAEPDTGVMEIAVRLVNNLAPARLRARSPLTGVAIGDIRTVLYEATIAAMRARLREEGFEPAADNAPIGAADSAALRAFQNDRGLDLTGAPDQPTLFTLFVRMAPEAP